MRPPRGRPRPSLWIGVAAAVWLAAAVGCALFRPTPLEVLPGHGVVVGRVELVGFPVGNAALDIVKDDGTYEDVLLAGVGHRDFALVLPRGRYRIAQLRVERDVGEGNQASWPLRLMFEAGAESAVYIGTLQLSATFGPKVGVSVIDEYEDTLRAVRALYTGLPEYVARRLLTLVPSPPAGGVRPTSPSRAVIGPVSQ